jgi:acetyl esterase/lipase
MRFDRLRAAAGDDRKSTRAYPMPSAEHEHVVETISPKVRPAHLSFEERQSGFAEAAATLFPKLAKDVRYETVDAGGVAAEWVVVPESGDGRVVFYLHGGGYTQGSPETHRELVSRVARHARARALCIDYRLAPAHPFPAAVEDALAAYNWLMDSGVSASSVAFAGDSAGGGLAVAMLLALRDRAGPLPSCVACLSPWFDLEGSGQSALADHDPIVQRQHLLEVAGVYLAGADPRHPHASPLHGQFEGLPPMLLQVGTRDLLLDDSRRLESAARAAGVDVDLEVWPGLIHVWHVWGDAVPEARAALESVGRFIRSHAAAHRPSTVALS